MRKEYNIKINLQSFKLRKSKLQELEKLIKNIEATNSDIYTMPKSAKQLLMNDLFNLNITTMQLLNIHLEDLSNLRFEQNLHDSIKQ